RPDTRCPPARTTRALRPAREDAVLSSASSPPEERPAGEDRPHPSTPYVLAIIDTATETACAVDDLVEGGFRESEIELSRGPDEAERNGGAGGRFGIPDLLVRLTERLAPGTASREMRERYEGALRDGSAVIAVLAPTEARKQLAVGILRECGAHFINFFGHPDIGRIVR